MKQTAVVFAYHNVGVCGLEAVLANDIDVKLVVTHGDNPDENIWFDSVAERAALNNLPVICPADPNTSTTIKSIKALQPDWIFSFYYRLLLSKALLEIPAQGALNLHGSLLPAYRGRVPVNWAIIHGERQCGASLHRMETKPDAGALIDQQAVPILQNDTAYQVFQKVTCAAEIVLMRSLPQLLQGSQHEVPLDLSAGSYFGGRKPEDGLIDWSKPASEIHNLIRAVAPPFPPAFFDVGSHRLHILHSYNIGEDAEKPVARLYWNNQKCYADCVDGFRFQITDLTVDQRSTTRDSFEHLFGSELLLS